MLWRQLYHASTSQVTRVTVNRLYGYGACSPSSAAPVVRSATTSTWASGGSLSNQRERAIRLKSMEKRRRQAGDKSDGVRSARSSKLSPRGTLSSRDGPSPSERRHPYGDEKAHRLRGVTVTDKLQAMKVRVEKGEQDATEAYNRATAMVEKEHVAIRARRVTNSQLMGLALLAKKGNEALDLLVEYKKKGGEPDLANWVVLLNGFYDLDLQAERDTRLVQRIDSVFEEAERIRRAALCPVAPFRVASSEKGPLQDIIDATADGSEGFKSRQDTPDESDENVFKPTHARLIHLVRDDPNLMDGVLANYVRLMYKIGRQDDAWSIMSRLSRDWAPNPDGYPHLSNRTVGFYMSAHLHRIALPDQRDKRVGQGQEIISQRDVERLIAILSDWRSLIQKKCRDIEHSYDGMLSEDRRMMLAAQWQATLPTGRQILDIVLLARASGSEQLSDLAVHYLSDFSDVPMPSKLTSFRNSLPQSLQDPLHPLCALCNFPVTQMDRESLRSLPKQRHEVDFTLERGFRDAAERPMVGQRALLIRAREGVVSNISMMKLFDELLYVVDQCTLDGAQDIFFEALTTTADRALAVADALRQQAPNDIRTESSSSLLKDGPEPGTDLQVFSSADTRDGRMGSRLNRALGERTVLHKMILWSKILKIDPDSGKHSNLPQRTPKETVRQVYRIIETMRELYIHQIVSDPPDELVYHRAMLIVTRALSQTKRDAPRQAHDSICGSQEARMLVQIGRWWLEDRLDSARTTASGRHGWLPWAEINGAMFLSSTIHLYKRIEHAATAAERQEKRLKRLGERHGTETAEVSTRGKSPEAAESREETQNPSVGHDDEARPLRQEAVETVRHALRLWFKAMTAQTSDQFNPVLYTGNLPFPSAEMLDNAGPARLNPRDRGTKMPQKKNWKAIATCLMSLIKLARQTVPGQKPLPLEETERLKALRQRCQEFVDTAFPEEKEARRRNRAQEEPRGGRQRRGVAKPSRSGASSEQSKRSQ